MPSVAGSRSYAAMAYRGVFWSALNAISMNAATFLVFVVMSRLLVPEQFGLSAVAGAVVAFFAMALPTGFGEAIVQREELVYDHVDAAFVLSFSIGLVTTCLAVLSGHLIASLYSSAALADVIPVLAVRILFDAIAIVPNALIARAMDFKVFAMRTAVTTAAAGILSVGMAWVGLGIWALIASQLVSAVVSTGVAFWASGYRPLTIGSWSALRELSHYGLFATGTRSVQFLSGQADQLLVGLFLGSEALGIYAFTKRVFGIVIDLTSGVLTAVAHPAFSSAQGNIPLIRRSVVRATSLVSLIAFPLFSGLAATAPVLIPALFGAKWQEAAVPLSLLCVLGILTCIGTIQAALINSLGKPSWWFSYQLLTGLTNVAVYAIVAPFGLSSMISIYVIKTYVLWPISVLMVVRLLGITWGDYLKPFWPPLFASASIYVVVTLVAYAMRSGALGLSLVVQILSGVVVYGTLLTLTAPTHPRDLFQSLSRLKQVWHA